MCGLITLRAASPYGDLLGSQMHCIPEEGTSINIHNGQISLQINPLVSYVVSVDSTIPVL